MRARKQTKPAQSIPAPPIEKPWWKGTWLKVTASIAALALLLTNVISILSSSRALPDEVQKTSDQFFNWYGNYAAWKGYWTNFPEGVVNMAEMKLSEEHFRLLIDESEYGFISGTIETRGVCEKVPYFDKLLIDGSISNSRKAEILIFDYVGGYRRNFARLKLKREDDIMTVIALDDPSGVFAKQTRIALAPDDLIGSDSHDPLCGDKQFKLMGEALKKIQAQGSAGSKEN